MIDVRRGDIDMASVNGLEGIVAAETGISLVDGEGGRLVYRGYEARDLARAHSFEDVAHLLWFGHLPGAVEREGLVAKLREHRKVPEEILRLVDQLPWGTDVMSVLRTVVSGLGVDGDWPPTEDQAIRVTAAVPTLIAHRHARLRGVAPTAAHPTLPHVANYLYMLSGGQIPANEHIRALQAYLVLGMEHGMNASTFAARVVTSTQSDMVSALTAAIGAMKGPLHGGAPSEVMTMLEDIGTLDRAEAWLRNELEAGRRLMGFGHRVYKTRDPRAMALRAVVEGVKAKDPWFDLSVGVEDAAVRLLDEYKPGRRLYANVEYWAAAILRTTGIPKTLYTPTFTLGRCVGWGAHIMEQARHNRLIRPQSVYIGPMPEGR